MPIPVLSEQIPAELRVQCRKPARTRDRWEKEAEVLQEWFARPGASGRQEIHAVPRDSSAWGTSIDGDLAARIGGHTGHPMDPSLRRSFEAQFGRELGDVRIHDDADACEMVQSLGAEAFTVGQEIFTTSPDRALLAHELVHTVQQEKVASAKPSRIQAAFEKTTAELDPKVEILLNLHLRSRGKQLKEIVETKLLVKESWWLKLRANLEKKDATPPVDTKAEVEAAVKQIRDLAPLDTAKGDPIQNGVAGLLADYLRVNDAPDLAAIVVIEFPYTRTAVPADEVVGALISEKKRGQRAVLALPRIWKYEKPTQATAETWTQEIADAVNQFLTLTPLAEHVKRRQAIVDALNAPLRGTSNIPDPTKAATPFDRLTDKSTLTANELDVFARNALAFIRGSWAALLQKRITESEQNTSATPFSIWGDDVEILDQLSGKLGSQNDPFNQLQKAEVLLPVLLEAHALLKKDVETAVDTHDDFWASVDQSVKYQSPGEADKYLKLTLGETTYAQLFFAAEEGALAAHLRDIVQPLADAAGAYFDLFDTRELPPLRERATVLQVFAKHRERADAFREQLRVNIQPAITRKVQLARSSGKGEIARGLGWFGERMERFYRTLENVPTLEESSGAAVLIDTIEKRGGIAYELWEIARNALGITEAEVSPSATPKPAAGKRDVPAAAAWQAILDRANAAFSLADIQTGLLVLQDQFEESEQTEMADLAKDIESGNLVGGLEPFTGGDLAMFYSTFYQRSMTEELTALSDEATAREASLQFREKEDLWLVQKAYDNLKEREGSDALPKRFASRSVYWIPYAGDDAQAFGRLLTQQKLYQDFVATHETRFNVILHVRGGPDERGDAWAWTLPIPSELVAPLYKIDLLRGLGAMSENDLEAALAKGVPTETRNAEEINAHALSSLIRDARDVGRRIDAGTAPSQNYYNWYAEVNARVRRVREVLQSDLLALSEVTKARQDTVTALAKDQKSARREYRLAQRRATTLDRRVIRRMNRELLQKAIDERIAGQLGIAVALDNHDAFRRAVRPSTPKSEALRQSAALLLDDADVWLEMVAEARLSGSDKTRTYTVISESLQTFPELLIEPVSTKGNAEPPEITQHSQGIAWETPSEKDFVAKKITEVTPKFQKVLDSLKENLRPLRWQLGITAKAGQGTLVSHLSPGFPLFTVGKIQEANAKEKDQSKHKSELIPMRGPLSMKIVNIHQDFTFLPGIGDRETASAEWQTQHALYIPAQVFVGVSASQESDLEKLEATHTEDPTILSFQVPKDSQGVPLVDIEIWEGDALFSKFTVHAGDIQGLRSGLNWLTGVVHNTAASEKFASMAADIELFAHALLFAASVFPPTALAATAAEVIGFLLQILGNPEFKEALESIAQDPIESLEHAASELKAHFTIERLFDLLMNGNFEPDRFLGAATLRGKKRSNSLTRGSLAKVLTRVKRIGAVLAVRLEGFQEAVQGPVHRIEYLMAKHPRLATMLAWLAGHLRELDDPEGLVLKHPLAGPIYEAYMLYRQLGRDESGASVIGQPLGEAATHLQGGLDRMANFELPATILPLDIAIEALVDLALKLAPKGGKIGIARALAQMAQEGLRSTGANTVVYGFLAEQVEDSWVDPNRYWRNDVVPLLGPPVKGVIQSAADTLGRQLSAAPLIGDYFGNDRVKNAKMPIPAGHRATLPNAQGAAAANVTTSEEADEEFDSEHVANLVPEESKMSEGRELSFSDVREMPDAFFEGIQKKPPASTPSSGSATGQPGPGSPPAGSPSPTPPGASAPGALSPTGHGSSVFANGAGAPLAPSDRTEAERHFGHDFSHVRLHQGPDSWAATAQRGADGLTVANHIFLRPDLSPRSGRGLDVMNHELAHVLQKTSEPGSVSMPASGGIRWKPGEESAADRMADQARQNLDGHPVPIQGAHRDGASPAISLDLMEAFFKKLSSPSAGASFAETIERAHERRKAAKVHPDSLARAETLWASIRSGIFGTLSVASHFKLSHLQIKNHLENRLSTLAREGESVPAASKVIAYIAALSEKEPPAPTADDKKKAAAGGGKPAKAKPTFDIPAFLADLSLYITGRSGIVFDFDLSPAEVQRLTTDPAATVTIDSKVSHIELLFVSSLSEAGLALWDAAIRNTTWKRTDDNKDRRDALRKVLETEFRGAAPPSTTSGGATPPAAGQPVAPKQPGRGLGSYTPLWDTSKTDLTLTSAYVEKVETQLSPAALSSDLMPSWGYFADPANEKFFTISGATSQVKQNAVHYDKRTHGELTDGTFFLEQNQRNSHHIIQYLLPEYFANIKEFQPFPKLKKGRNYPGVKASGTQVETISGDSQNIGVAETEKGSRRGHAMPAILLSEEAHLNSGLHVTPKPDDTGKATQGYSIHREFRKFLAESVNTRLAVKRDGDALDDYLLTMVGNPKAEAAVVDAVRQTYAWIKGENQANLLAADGMAGHEADFYISQFRGSADGKKNFHAINQKDYDNDSADIRSRIQTRIHSKAQTVLDEAVKVLAQPPLGWKLPGA